MKPNYPLISALVISGYGVVRLLAVLGVFAQPDTARDKLASAPPFPAGTVTTLDAQQARALHAAVGAGHPTAGRASAAAVGVAADSTPPYLPAVTRWPSPAAFRALIAAESANYYREVPPSGVEVVTLCQVVLPNRLGDCEFETSTEGGLMLIETARQAGTLIEVRPAVIAGTPVAGDKVRLTFLFKPGPTMSIKSFQLVDPRRPSQAVPRGPSLQAIWLPSLFVLTLLGMTAAIYAPHRAPRPRPRGLHY